MIPVGRESVVHDNIQNIEHLSGIDSVFEYAESQTDELRDEFILGALNSELETTPGNRAMFIKYYLDRVGPDASDQEILGDPNNVADLHDQLIDLIIDNIVVVGPALDEEDQAVLEGATSNYTEHLRRSKSVVRDFILNEATGQTSDSLRSGLEFYGLRIGYQGQTIELTSQNVSGVLVNFYVQRELTDTFIHWRTQACMENPYSQRATHRIYLNPRVYDTAGIFEEIMSEAEAKELEISGKTLARSVEFLDNMNKDLGKVDLRGDGIVLYAGQDAEALVAIVLETYRRHSESFKGRGMSKVPFVIADGLALGNEPKTERAESLTSHRAALLERIITEVRQDLGLMGVSKVPEDMEETSIALFREKLQKYASEAGVNPQNIAFNL